MGCSCCHYYDFTLFFKFPESFKNIASVIFYKLFKGSFIVFMIHLCKFIKYRIKRSSFNLFFSKFDSVFKIFYTSFLKKFIIQHRSKSRRYCKCYAKRNIISIQPVKNPEQRKISFCDSFIQPAFFNKSLIRGMPHKRQMRV